MTIEQIITELKNEIKFCLREAENTQNTQITKTYNFGKACGIKIAIQWLNYLKNKTESYTSVFLWSVLNTGSLFIFKSTRLSGISNNTR